MASGKAVGYDGTLEISKCHEKAVNIFLMDRILAVGSVHNFQACFSYGGYLFKMVWQLQILSFLGDADVLKHGDMARGLD